MYDKRKLTIAEASTRVLAIAGGTRAHVVLIGPPLSGKSELAHQLGMEPGMRTLSSSAIRGELQLGPDHDPRVVWAELIARLHMAVSAGEVVVVDATNALAADRKRLLSEIRAASRGAAVLGVLVRASAKGLKRRNVSLGRAVKPAVLRRIHREVDAITPHQLFAEGFTRALELRLELVS